MSSRNIENKVALVLGASRGIGRATALRLAKAKARIIAVSRSVEELATLKQEIQAAGASCLTVGADASEESGIAAIEKAMEQTTEFATVDFLINNLGIGKYGNLADFSVADYDAMMNTNMRSNFLATKAFSPAMLKKGAGQVVFISSVAGLRGLPGESIYCATKFAQVGFAQSLDHEFRKKGVKVSVIAPGGVKTHFALGSGRTPGDLLLDRMMDAEEIAETVHFVLAQEQKTRLFLVGLRPMMEPL